MTNDNDWEMITVTVTELEASSFQGNFQYLPYGRLRGEVVSKDVRISPRDKVDQAVVAYLSSGETTSNQSPPRSEMDFRVCRVDEKSGGEFLLKLFRKARLADQGISDGGRLFIVYQKRPPIVNKIKKVVGDVDGFTKIHYLAWILYAFVLTILSIFVARGVWVLTHQDTPSATMGHDDFGIVIDAGSVHTSVYVYQWPVGHPALMQEMFQCEFDEERGVSSFVDNPSQVQTYIGDSQCMREAMDKVKRGETSRVYMGCTGGMRSIMRSRPSEANQLLGNLSEALISSSAVSGKVLTGLPKVEILDGIDEGLYGWVTVNAKNLGRGRDWDLVGSLDWGGASSQITFPIEGPLTNDTSGSEEHVKNVTVFNESNRIYSVSQLCYGQSSALNRYFVQLIYDQYLETGKIQSALASPCQPKGMGTYEIQGQKLLSTCTRMRDEKFQSVLSKEGNRTLTFVGTGEPAVCESMIRDQFDVRKCKATHLEHRTCFNSKRIARPSKSLKFYAFSTYWYLVQVLKVPESKASKVDSYTFRIRDLDQTLDKVCVNSTSTLMALKSTWGSERAHNSCFRAIFMKTLLTQGYGFTNWTAIEFVSKVDGASVGWNRGYLLSHLSDYYKPKIAGDLRELISDLSNDFQVITDAIASDPELSEGLEYFIEPSNPHNMAIYESNPKVMSFINRIQSMIQKLASKWATALDGLVKSILNDPDIQEALRDPELMEALKNMVSDPATAYKYLNKPKVKSLLGALFSKLPSTWVQELEQLENYLLYDRGIRTAFSDPEVTSAIQEVASNPLTVVKCFSNPKVASVIKIELERIRRYLYHRRVAPQTWVSQAQRVRTRKDQLWAYIWVMGIFVLLVVALVVFFPRIYLTLKLAYYKARGLWVRANPCTRFERSAYEEI